MSGSVSPVTITPPTSNPYGNGKGMFDDSKTGYASPKSLSSSMSMPDGVSSFVTNLPFPSGLPPSLAALGTMPDGQQMEGVPDVQEGVMGLNQTLSLDQDSLGLAELSSGISLDASEQSVPETKHGVCSTKHQFPSVFSPPRAPKTIPDWIGPTQRAQPPAEPEKPEDNESKLFVPTRLARAVLKASLSAIKNQEERRFLELRERLRLTDGQYRKDFIAILAALKRRHKGEAILMERMLREELDREKGEDEIDENEEELVYALKLVRQTKIIENRAENREALGRPPPPPNNFETMQMFVEDIESRVLSQRIRGGKGERHNSKNKEGGKEVVGGAKSLLAVEKRVLLERLISQTVDAVGPYIEDLSHPSIDSHNSWRAKTRLDERRISFLEQGALGLELAAKQQYLLDSENEIANVATGLTHKAEETANVIRKRRSGIQDKLVSARKREEKERGRLEKAEHDKETSESYVLKIKNKLETVDLKIKEEGETVEKTTQSLSALEQDMKTVAKELIAERRRQEEEAKKEKEREKENEAAVEGESEREEKKPEKSEKGKQLERQLKEQREERKRLEHEKEKAGAKLETLNKEKEKYSAALPKLEKAAQDSERKCEELAPIIQEMEKKRVELELEDNGLGNVLEMLRNLDIENANGLGGIDDTPLDLLTQPDCSVNDQNAFTETELLVVEPDEGDTMFATRLMSPTSPGTGKGFDSPQSPSNERHGELKVAIATPAVASNPQTTGNETAVTPVSPTVPPLISVSSNLMQRSKEDEFITSLMSKFGKIPEVSAELQSTNQYLRQKLGMLKSMGNNSDGPRPSRHTVIEELKNELNALERQISESSALLAKRKEEQAQEESHLKNVQLERTSNESDVLRRLTLLREERTSKAADVSREESRLIALAKEKEILEQELKETLSLLDVEAGKIKAAQGDNAALFEKLSDAKTSQEEAQKEYNNEKQRLKDLAEESKKIKENIQEIEDRKEERRKSLLQLKDTLARLQKEIDGLSTEKASVEAKIAEYEKSFAEVERIRRRIEELQEQTAKYQRETEELQQQRNKRQKELEAIDIILRQEQFLRKSFHNIIQDLKGKIRVYCRVRPFNKREIELNSYKCVRLPDQYTIVVDDIRPGGNTGLDGIVAADPKSPTSPRAPEANQTVKTPRSPPGNPTGASPTSKLGVKSPAKTTKAQEMHSNFDPTKTFFFDRCFDWTTNQEEIFNDVSFLIRSAMDGFNVCLFAYGQTGSGKTFTMIGASDGTHQGIAPRAIYKLFDNIKTNANKNVSFKCKVYMLEIYCDNLRDLLFTGKPDNIEKHNRMLNIVEGKNKLVQIQNCVRMAVSSPEETFSVLESGFSTRTTRKTGMNDESSRSHLVFSIVIKSTNSVTGKKMTGKLSIVDLAGSERVKKTGATAELLEEAKAINKSLSALGDVISALARGEAFVPYRNSVLTKLMKDSIGGNAKTLMFVNISPSDDNSQETINSLTYASRVRQITNSSAKEAEDKKTNRLNGLLEKMRKS